MKLLVSPDLNLKSLLKTFTIVAFLMSVGSLILGHIFISCLPATVLTILFFSINLLFTRLSRIDEFSVNLKTGSVEAKDDDKDLNDKSN